ncbi:hypothetical protein ACG9YX_13385 [Acinetobacter nematophilus]|uniref:hypothetical protein n=1 Tax=Acinetobacter nematophilus TaxID=2994642 RepID=UPI003AF76355
MVTHEDAHQVGFGEKSSEALGWMGEAAFNVNSWVNSSNINTVKTQVQNIPKVEIAGVNDAQAQKDLLNANQIQLGLQQALGDEFNDRQPSYARANKIDERLGQDVKTHSSVIFGGDKSVLLAAPTIANDLKIAGKCKTDSECNNIAARLNMGEKKYFIASEQDSKRIQAEVLITQLGGDFRNYVNSNPEVRKMVIQLLNNAQKEPAVDISQLYNLAEGLAYVRMYKDSGVMPPKGFISALGESHNLNKASKFDEVIRKNSTAYPQDFAIDDLKVPGRQIDTALTIAGSVLTVADIAFIGANGLKAFTAMKAAKTAEKAELAAAKVSNNFNADLPNVLDGNPNAPADFALGNKKAVDINAGVNNPHYDSKHGAYTRLEQQYERAMKGTNPQTGAKGAPADASKFFNSTDMKTAIDQAETLYKQNPAKYTQPNGSISVNITFRRPIGEGYIGNTKANIKSNQPIGEYRWSNTATVNIDRNTGKAFTAFPNVKLGVTKPDPLKLR